MRVEIEDWKNGWAGVRVALSLGEIDVFIQRLTMLKNDPEQHFHISSDNKGSGGVGDIEIYVKGPNDTDNMFLSSRAMQPGEEI